MWIISQNGKVCVQAIALTADTSDMGTVLSAYAGDGTVESAFTVGVFREEQQAMEELLRFRQYLGLIIMEPFHIQPDR
ncbi:hypothetical protein [Paenibacillus wulumuqiensis]|uniref:hypothetical protein n=1 Tax=Paenibacillus wulumuqiensis TaxID=1567107 RepID=UPI000619D2A6|nr:hypothetical protein [Paenibacillus wulumuqiensis]